jgi:metal-dependent amidase/aminoacylase/carboxypeptidase family protein
MASSNEFKITIRGKGSHAALPHNGIDPVPVACQMVQAFRPSSPATKSRWTRA